MRRTPLLKRQSLSPPPQCPLGPISSLAEQGTSEGCPAVPCPPLQPVSVTSQRLTKGTASAHTPRTLAGQRFPECLPSPEPVSCVCIANRGTGETGEGGKCCPKKTYHSFVVGICSGGGWGRGKLDFVFVNKLSFTQNEVCAVCFVPRTDTRGQNTAGQGKDGVLITMLLELAFWLPGPPRGLAR